MMYQVDTCLLTQIHIQSLRHTLTHTTHSAVTRSQLSVSWKIGLKAVALLGDIIAIYGAVSLFFHFLSLSLGLYFECNVLHYSHYF